MFGRKKTKKPLREMPYLWSIAGVIFLCLGFLVYRLVTFPDAMKKFITHADGIRFDHLFSVVYPLDPEGAKAFTSLTTLLQTQVDKKTGTELINNILRPLQEQQGPMVNLLQRYFPEHATFFHELSFLSGDIRSLLGMNAPQTYLIVLQNTAEKRPNGGFFGSFALLTLEGGKVTDMSISDSYHPEYNTPGTKLLGPEWFDQFLPERDIYFVGANKVGFTYQDGPHIKTLYEKSYPGTTIRGVVFLRTDMFTKLLPDFTEQLRRWQYINATVDLIRGEERRGKKELYLGSLEEYLKEHRMELVQAFWSQLPTILHDQQINIYLDEVSGKMHTLIRKWGLTTRFEDNHAYFRDSNIIFNKLDTFVQKEIYLTNELGEHVGFWTGDIVSLPTLISGNTYTFAVNYTLHVPETYHEWVRKMNEQYGVVLGQREEHILGVHHEWATRGNVYFPPQFTIQNIQGDINTQRTFETPFSHNAAYETHIGENDVTNTILISVKVE